MFVAFEKRQLDEISKKSLEYINRCSDFSSSMTNGGYGIFYDRKLDSRIFSKLAIVLIPISTTISYKERKNQ